jgi:hypothetical protein
MAEQEEKRKKQQPPPSESRPRGTLSRAGS